MYVVIGATGNTGRVVAEDLLSAGLPVRVIGRSEEGLAPFVKQGAEAAVGDVSDAEFVARACDGVGGVYHLIPPRYDIDLRAWQTEVGKALLAGIRDSGVPYVGRSITRVPDRLRGYGSRRTGSTISQRPMSCTSVQAGSWRTCT
jgi:saccharopine dehydrogenase-like NADP-dependent oxidoreductase